MVQPPVSSSPPDLPLLHRPWHELMRGLASTSETESGEALRVTLRLCSIDYQSNREPMVAAGVLPALADLLRSHGRLGPRSRRTVFECLVNLSVAEANRGKIMDEAGIYEELIKQIRQQIGGGATVQAMKLLVNLSLNVRNRERIIASPHVVKRVVRIVRTGTGEAQKWGLWVLTNLSIDEESASTLVQCDTVDVLATAAQSHNVELKSKGLMAARNLAKFPVAAQPIVESGLPGVCLQISLTSLSSNPHPVGNSIEDSCLFLLMRLARFDVAKPHLLSLPTVPVLLPHLRTDSFSSLKSSICLSLLMPACETENANSVCLHLTKNPRVVSRLLELLWRTLEREGMRGWFEFQMFRLDLVMAVFESWSRISGTLMAMGRRRECLPLLFSTMEATTSSSEGDEGQIITAPVAETEVLAQCVSILRSICLVREARERLASEPWRSHVLAVKLSESRLQRMIDDIQWTVRRLRGVGREHLLRPLHRQRLQAMEQEPGYAGTGSATFRQGDQDLGYHLLIFENSSSNASRIARRLTLQAQQARRASSDRTSAAASARLVPPERPIVADILHSAKETAPDGTCCTLDAVARTIDGASTVNILLEQSSSSSTELRLQVAYAFQQDKPVCAVLLDDGPHGCFDSLPVHSTAPQTDVSTREQRHISIRPEDDLDRSTGEATMGSPTVQPLSLCGGLVPEDLASRGVSQVAFDSISSADFSNEDAVELRDTLIHLPRHCTA